MSTFDHEYDVDNDGLIMMMMMRNAVSFIIQTLLFGSTLTIVGQYWEEQWL